MNQIIYAGKHLLTFSVVRHSHANWELVCCTSGSGRFEFDTMALPYQAGDIVVIPPFLPHVNLSDEGFTNIHLNMKDLAVSFKQPTLLHSDGNRFLLNAFAGAFYHFSSSDGRQTGVLNAYGHLIASYLMELQDTRNYTKVVEEISNKIINTYPDCDFELDAYLRELPFSYDYVRKLFKKEIGVTPHRYLNDLRLHVAAQYLTHNNQSSPNITEIAHMCGFREPLYFSRMFKKKYGVSPSAYAAASGAESAPKDSDSMKILL
ncbi:MAG: AraC family transcriptional regulator [Oscillospiraceae bacterium]|nr:AraC family transcriptional regulator [Oscillospiraceae bacterium]